LEYEWQAISAPYGNGCNINVGDVMASDYFSGKDESLFLAHF